MTIETLPNAIGDSKSNVIWCMPKVIVKPLHHEVALYLATIDTLCLLHGHIVFDAVLLHDPAPG